MHSSVRPLLFISFFLLVSACGGGSTDSSNTRASSIVTLGDSIGAGACGTTPWGIQLAQSLGVPVVNDSVFSRTTAIGLSRVDALLATHKPSHLVVLLGTNDARQNMVSQAIANMTAIVQKARSAGVVPVIGTVVPNYASGSANALAVEISNAYKGIPGAVVADVRSALGNNTALFCDGIHPNAAGQAVITSSFRGAF
jgi:acyl-CoA thioesterase-1